MKIIKFFLSIFIFLLILTIVYIAHINFFHVKVVFYSAILDSIIATLVTVIIITFSSFFKTLNIFEKFQISVIFILIGYSFAISIPTVIDRSLSFYILEKIQQRGGGIQKSAFEDIFTKEYIIEHSLVDVRLTEQLQSGTIVIENNCVKLTNRGNFIALTSRFFRKNFLPKKRLLMETYTDQLIDPFRNELIDKEKLDYTCN